MLKNYKKLYTPITYIPVTQFNKILIETFHHFYKSLSISGNYIFDYKLSEIMEILTPQVLLN